MDDYFVEITLKKVFQGISFLYYVCQGECNFCPAGQYYSAMQNIGPLLPKLKVYTLGNPFTSLDHLPLTNHMPFHPNVPLLFYVLSHIPIL